MDIKQQALDNCMRSLSGAYESDCITFTKEVVNYDFFQNVVDLYNDDCYEDISRKMTQLNEGISSICFGNVNNEHLEFFLSHTDFIQEHFESIIRKYEGNACCHDKSSVIMNSIFYKLKKNREIKFDYEAKYTFHLPKKAFTNENEIMNFFRSLIDLYYGRSDKFLDFINNLEAEYGR